MNKDDTRLIEPIDLPAAIGLLTRLPIRVDTDHAIKRGAYGAWAYPVVGMITGLILAIVANFLLLFNLSDDIVAAMVLCIAVIMTGAMHEDGLADTVDGLWGGWDRTRRLEIMKDSHIGVYGVCAIALSLLIRWLAIEVIISSNSNFIAFMIVGAVSRASMVGVMAALPNARDNGLSRRVGRPKAATTRIAFGIAAGLAVISGYFAILVIVSIIAIICARIAQAKIGGQTGDILGATQQATEITALIAVAAIIA